MKNAILTALAIGALGATPAMANGDWAGFYAGIGVGNLDVDTNVGLSDDDVAYGIHGGYRFDFGTWVAGGELEYDWSDVGLAPGVSVDNVLRFKGSVGYDLGPTLIYLAAGTSEVDVSGLGDDWGGFYGIGLAYQITPSAILSAEILEHEFNNIGGSGIDADATSFNLRASLRF